MCAGLVLAISSFAHTLLLMPFAVFGTIAILSVCCVYALIISLASARLMLPWFRQQPTRSRIVFGGIALLASGLIIGSLPNTFYEIQLAAPPVRHLEIIATGERNSLAQASEVWILRLEQADGTPVATTDYQLDGLWESRDGAMFSSAKQTATMRWQSQMNDGLRLHLLTHQWSGRAIVRWDNQEQMIDLYAPITGERVVELAAYERVLPAWQHAALRVTDGLSLCVLLLLCAAIVPWMRRRIAIGANAGLDWPVVVGVVMLSVPLAVPVAWLIGPLDGPRPIDYLVAWAYAIIALSVAVMLIGYSIVLPIILPKPWIDWLAQPIAGQLRGVWIFALIAIVAGAFLIVPRISPLDQAEATWVRISVDLPSNRPPPASVQLEHGGQAIPVQWQPYATTQVAIWAKHGQTRILAITSDQGRVALKTINLSGAQLDPAGILLNADRALLNWPQSSRSITLTLAPGNGDTTLFWLDQQQTIALGPQPTQAFFSLPGRFQGWALLPTHMIQQLTVAFPKLDAPIAIRSFEMISTPPWDIAMDRTAWESQGCDLQQQSNAMMVVPTGTQCSVVPLHGPMISQYRWLQTLALSALVALIVIGGLWFVTQVARRWQWLAALAPEQAHLPVFRRSFSGGWSTGRIALVLWIVALGYHLLYSITTPMAYTNDSTDYYASALQFIALPRFAVLTGIRTPGYPGFLAFIVTVFGESGVAITLFQHLMLAALGPLTFWFLVGRIPLLAAILAGVSVGIAPMISITGNILWTEPLYTTLTTTALLLSIDRVGLRRSLIIGMLVGAATMVRPTGLLLMAVLIGWKLLTGWLAIGQWPKQRRALMQCLALAIGYCVIAGPWHAHLALARNTGDLSQGLTGFTSWATSVYQGRITEGLPINRPNRAIWAVPSAWNGDPFTIYERFPQTNVGLGVGAQDYYVQAIRESQRFNAQITRDNQILALGYNLFLRRADDPRFRHFAELSALANSWIHPVNQDISSSAPTTVREQLDRAVYRWMPEQSFMRIAVLNSSLWIAQWWWVIGVLALLSISMLVGVPFARSFIPMWLYWAALIVATSWLGMPAERYVAVAEPLLYVLVCITLFSFGSRFLQLSARIATRARVHKQNEI